MMLAQWIGDRQRGGSHRRQRASTRTRWPSWSRAGRRAGRPTRPSAARTPWTRPRCCSPRPGPRRRLWERRADDPDTLQMRVGLFDGPAGPAGRERRPGRRAAAPADVFRNVPVPLPLAAAGRARPGRAAGRVPGLARWLVGPGRGPAQPARPPDRGAGPPTRRRARTGTGSAGCRTARRARARPASRWSAPTRLRPDERVAELAAEVTARLEKARSMPGVMAGRASRRPAATWGRRSWSCWTGPAAAPHPRHASGAGRGPPGRRRTPSASTSPTRCCPRSAPRSRPGHPRRGRRPPRRADRPGGWTVASHGAGRPRCGRS